jgi:hypothetical protein
LANEIRDLPFVDKVGCLNAKGRLFDRFHFPIKVMNKYRAILMRGGPLLKMEKHLEEMLGSAGASLLYEEGRSYARAVMVHLKDALPNASHEELLQNVTDGLRATGWGLFQFHEQDDVYQISVKHPPRSEENLESMFFRGVAVGATEAAYTLNLAVRNADYDEKTDTLRLTLGSVKKKRSS